MDFNVILWIVIMVLLLIVEAMTMNLTTIWLAVGALASVFFTLAGAGGVAQFAVFVIVSAIMVFVTRPLVKKYVAGRYQKTNSDGLVGRYARIIEPVNNKLETGTAFLDGKEWTVRSVSDDDLFNEGDIVVVREIEGVKLIVAKEGTEIPKLVQSVIV